MQVSRNLGAYGVTLVLGLFGATGLVRGCKPAAPAPAPAKVATVLTVADQCTSMVNAERAARGIAPVSIHPAVQFAAESHAKYEAIASVMTHVSPNGARGGDRIAGSGYAWRAWGENVAAGQPDCATVMAAWMNSAGHKANILNPAFVHIGVAAAANGAGVVYWTMDLANG
ncbi:MAG: CAP domain-containing protein [Actinobacteria bacterium]|nr:CAP domain-containing protein [Actinomycetota bacterium]